jgi:hypothetical protein
MIKFEKPANLNGKELVEELAAAGVLVLDVPEIDGDGNFWLHIKEEDKAKAETIVKAHNGTQIVAQPTIDEKLASVGLSLIDLKAALGL